MSKKNILWFDQVGKEDGNLVGGKGANLGEMVSAGIPVPGGFIVTAQAYFDFLEEAKLKAKLMAILKGVNVDDPRDLDRVAKAAKRLISDARVPVSLASEIMNAYVRLNEGQQGTKSPLDKLKKQFSSLLVAVRSSATAEDLPGASFAGQQATFLNVSGESNVVEKVKECWASLFEARAIFYRVQQHFDHFKVGIAVPVQKMVQSHASGVMFTVDPVEGSKSTIIIEAIWGLGEYIVQGTVTPDHYEVDKKTMHITKKTIVAQDRQLILGKDGTRDMHITKEEGKKQKISDKEILAIAILGKKLEKHYYFPQDVEWAIEDGKVYVVQTRPITTLKKAQSAPVSTISDLGNMKVLATGDPASPGIGTGRVRFVRSVKDIHRVRAGDVLVAPQTNPDYVPAMRKAVAIVTERGGRTSHAAIVSRELGVPAVVGAVNAMKLLKSEQVVTVEGSTGKIFEGAITLPTPQIIATSSASGKERIKTATRVYVNLAEPSRAQDIAKRHVDGIGLLRAEFMIAHIGYHPKKLIQDGKAHKFVDALSEQLEIFCSAFNPRPVVYRATDFKTNEYRNLIGGKAFEPEEANPMLGFRGASRYVANPDVFMLELEAIKKIRNKKNLKNLWLMLPFVRTPDELAKVKKIIASAGLLRTPSFKLWMMVELPINVILLEDFIKVGIDGVSIGSNDLTMLIMGTDRDNSEVANVFDERNPAVLWALERVITTCKKYNITSSICGQAPSDYPELVEKLVGWGVTSVSVNPDAIERVRETVKQAENKLLKHTLK